MNVWVRRAVATGFAVTGVLGLGALSRVPYAAESASHAVVRLAWRTRGARVRECRHRTPEELASLPAHMREEEVCEGRVLPYHLTWAIDGAPAGNDLVRAAGARGDRPLYVYREVRFPPGSHRVQIEFIREGTVGVENRLEERAEGQAEHGEATPTPAKLVLDTVVTLREREILLVTYDPEAGRLVVRAKAGP